MTLVKQHYGNKTMFGIAKNAELYTWIGYHLFVIASSLLGDTIILIASIKYRSFKLHKSITIIIQHMAVCDLMVLTTLISPTLASLVAGQWIFGDFVGYLTYFLRNYFGFAGILLICAMTASKVLLLKHPLRFGTKSRKATHKICIVCWMAALIHPCIYLVDSRDIYFSYRTYNFEYGFSSDAWSYLRPLFSLIFALPPTCFIITTTAYLLVIAKRVSNRNRDSLKWEGIVTTVLTGTVYCLSVLPYAIYNALDSNLTVENKASSFFHTTFFRIARLFLYLNTISNFYIYCLTVTSFRKFLRSKLKFLSWQPSHLDTTSAGSGRGKKKMLLNLNS